MNFKLQMLPGLVLLGIGAAACFLAPRICRNEKQIMTVKLVSVFVAFIGTIAVFTTN